VASSDNRESYVILIPVFDDWDSLRLLVPLLDSELARAGLHARLLVIDDGSQVVAADLIASPLAALAVVDILRLHRNVGHQRAIAIGLAHVAENEQCAGVVVMDSDGEDRPSDVPLLIDALNRAEMTRAIFAKRARRSEGIGFRMSYWLFRLLHEVLTGIRVEVGNFSALPLGMVRRLATVSELWNHYAAAVVQAHLPRELVPMDRGVRLAGESRMNFAALVTHGLSAISVFADRIGVRLLVASTALGAGALIVAVGVLAVRFGTSLALPAWATSAMGFLILLLAQAMILSLMFTLFVQLGRSTGPFLPARDYKHFVGSVHRIYAVDD